MGPGAEVQAESSDIRSMCWWQWVGEPADGLTGERKRRIKNKLIITETGFIKNQLFSLLLQNDPLFFSHLHSVQNGLEGAGEV